MARKRHSYKEIRLQQLRSFCESARQGSLRGAAVALGLSQPTVWEQVHALERVFGARLVETGAHGCRLTSTGLLLSKLAAPLVSGIDSLKEAIQDARSHSQALLTLAATQRILSEDLPEPIIQFERRQPQILLRLLEMGVQQICPAIESGEADLGLTTQQGITPASPWLEVEPAYELDLLLITPPGHPLAKRRSVTPRDLKKYPLVNSPHGMPDPAITAALEKLGAFDAQPRRVEAFYNTVIRRYVELGFGIGLVLGLPGRRNTSGLHERSMSRHFGRVTIFRVWRKGALLEQTREFVKILAKLRSARSTKQP